MHDALSGGFLRLLAGPRPLPKPRRRADQVLHASGRVIDSGPRLRSLQPSDQSLPLHAGYARRNHSAGRAAVEPSEAELFALGVVVPIGGHDKSPSSSARNLAGLDVEDEKMLHGPDAAAAVQGTFCRLRRGRGEGPDSGYRQNGKSQRAQAMKPPLTSGRAVRSSHPAQPILPGATRSPEPIDDFKELLLPLAAMVLVSRGTQQRCTWLPTLSTGEADLRAPARKRGSGHPAAVFRPKGSRDSSSVDVPQEGAAPSS